MPPRPRFRPGNEPLAGWLAAHGLTRGLASYWQANSTTVASSGHVVVSAVVPDVRGRLVPYLWESDVASYDPARHYANFVVADGPAAHGRACSCPRGSRSASPARTYHVDGYTILGLEHERAGQAGRPA